MLVVGSSSSRLTPATNALLAAAASSGALQKAASMRPRAPAVPRAPVIVAAASPLSEDPDLGLSPSHLGKPDGLAAKATSARARASAVPLPLAPSVPLFVDADLSLTPSHLVKPDVMAAIAHRRAASSRDLTSAGAALARSDSGFDATALKAAGAAGAAHRSGAVRDDKGRLAFPVSRVSGGDAHKSQGGGDSSGGGGGGGGGDTAADEAAAGLPAGWKPVWSKTQARFYWACKETGEKVWEKPVV